MTRKIYRTAQGKMVDIGRLQLQNENIRAVGNMNVNARGDKIDSQNKAIEKRPAQVQRQYNRQTKPSEQTSPTPARTRSVPAPKIEIPAAPEDFDDAFVKEESPKPASGLAAAIAKAREIKQEPLRSVQDTVQHQTGIKKI